QIERQLIFVWSAERIGINRSSAAREQRLLVSDAALTREGCKHIRQAVRQERRSAIHDMEVEMRRVGIAGIAEQPEYLAFCHLVARPDAHAARLRVRIEGEASFSDIDDDIVAERHLKRDALRELAGHLLGAVVRHRDDATVGNGIDLLTKKGIT